jgi:hypothetical protein
MRKKFSSKGKSLASCNDNRQGEFGWFRPGSEGATDKAKPLRDIKGSKPSPYFFDINLPVLVGVVQLQEALLKGLQLLVRHGFLQHCTLVAGNNSLIRSVKGKHNRLFRPHPYWYK